MSDRRKAGWGRRAALLAVAALSWWTPADARAASNPLALPLDQTPPGTHLDPDQSHTLTLADIAGIADPATADIFRRNGWRTGYEERMGTRDYCRVLLDVFVFATSAGARGARGAWTEGTPGQSTVIAHLPVSAQAFESLVHAPGVPGWDVQVIFRVARTLVDVDSRCRGTDNGSLQRARALAARITRSYDAWIVAHPPR